MENSLNSGMSDNSFFERRIEMIIDTNNKKILNEINALKAVVVKINEDMAELRRNITNMSISAPVHSSRQETYETSSFEEQRQTVHEPPKRPVPIMGPPSLLREQSAQQSGAAANSQTQNRPRYGDYKSEDVSVEKFFSFGSKRR